MIKKYNQIFENINTTELVGTKLYQICAHGEYKHFSGKNKYYSQKVYLTEPDQNEINNFINNCCNSTDKAKSLYDLEQSTVQIKNKELIIS